MDIQAQFASAKLADGLTRPLHALLTHHGLQVLVQ
jgi:hypothetical protein